MCNSSGLYSPGSSISSADHVSFNLSNNTAFSSDITPPAKVEPKGMAHSIHVAGKEG